MHDMPPDDALNDNFLLRNENVRLCGLVEACEAQLEIATVRHEKAVLSFAETVQCIVKTPGRNKRARVDDCGRDGIDQHIDGLLERKEAANLKAMESLKVVHRKEIQRLQAKMDEPINEFRIAKQFHIKEAELRKKIGQLEYRLEEEQKRSSASEWGEREKSYMKKDLAEMKIRCSERDGLLARIEQLEGQVLLFEYRLLEGNPRVESEARLLERVETLVVI